MSMESVVPEYPDGRYDLRVLRAIRQIIRSTDLYSRKISSQFGLTTPQLVCLTAIHKGEAMTAVEISREVYLTQSTLVGILDRLEAKGLIVRERNKKDRRKIIIRATQEGRSLIDHAPSLLQDQLTSALFTLEENEQAQIATALERVVELMEIQDLDASPLLETGAVLDDEA